MKEISPQKRTLLDDAIYGILSEFPQFNRLDLDTQSEIVLEFADGLITNMRVEFE